MSSCASGAGFMQKTPSRHLVNKGDLYYTWTGAPRPGDGNLTVLRGANSPLLGDKGLLFMR